MKTLLAPYINFKGKTEEAMEFYKTVFGGKIELHTFKEYGAAQKLEEENLIMHSMIEADNGLTFMAADVPSGMEYKEGTNFSISLSGDNDEELSGYFNKLAEGGTTLEPLEKAVWGDKFGMLIDKFGVKWLVNIGGPKK